MNTVLSLLDGEKIDFVEADDDKIEFIKKLLKPAHVLNVDIIDDGKKALVKVNEEEKAMAIGKGASNIKLASQLAGMHIEIV
ncbi:MAG: KH domain-containing protein [Candidatus Peribacteria bacterium]|nr:KH domain-containing protein [Candidatus Peribacteria bacterium]